MDAWQVFIYLPIERHYLGTGNCREKKTYVLYNQTGLDAVNVERAVAQISFAQNLRRSDIMTIGYAASVLPSQFVTVTIRKFDAGQGLIENFQQKMPL